MTLATERDDGTTHLTVIWGDLDDGRIAVNSAEGRIDKLAKKYLDKEEYPFRRPGEKRVKFLIEPEWVSVQGG